MPRGGFQTSLVGLINALSPFRRQSAPQFSTRPPTTPGKGAPIYSYAWGQNPGYAPGSNGANTRPIDITRYAPVFQPSGGLFAPGYPLVPVEYERTRRLNFPVGINTIYTPRSFEPIGFPELKALATDDITRLCIETRKDQIEKLGWVIKPRNEKDVASKAQARIQQLTEFWEYPDGITPFATWLRQVMDQVLVADCPALEPRRNRGGELIGFDIIEGSTIKVLIDDTGRRPRPPAPAYQQIIHGRPWVMLQDGSRTNTEEGDIVGEFTDQELIYFPRNPRPDHLYGFSPVEQIILTINTSIRRGVMQLQHFTVGNVPAGMVNSPLGWTPEQIAQFQDWFDSKLSGNTAERTKLLWGPEGAKYQAIKEAPLKDDFDEWRARVICFAFSLPPTAFTKQVNRNTAETAQEAALEEGLAPLMSWVARLVNGIIQRRMGHPDLEFAWSDATPVSPKEQADMVVELTGAGLQTLNEGRDVLGLGPVQGGDEIMFKTATGPVTLDSVLNPPEPPPMTSMSIPGGPGQPPGKGQNGPKPPAKQGKPPANDGKQPPKPAPGKEQEANPGEKPAKAGDKAASAGANEAEIDPEVGKTAANPFARAKATSRRNTALILSTQIRLQRKLHTFFATRAKDVAAQLARELRLEGWEQLGKAGWDDVPRDDKGRWASGGAVKLTATNERAWNGRATAVEAKPGKAETGSLGEQIALAYLKSSGLEEAKPLHNQTATNFPLDMIGDHELFEVKTGVASSQTPRWRATIGEPGPKEKEWLKTATPIEKSIWNSQKVAAALERKTDTVRQFSEHLGRDVKGKTVAIIVHPDKAIADVHVIDGFHANIGWNSQTAKDSYVGSFRYKQVKKAAGDELDELLASSDALLKAEAWEDVPRDDKGRWEGTGAEVKPATDLRSMTKEQFAEHLSQAVPGVRIEGDLHPDFRSDLVHELGALTKDFPLDKGVEVRLEVGFGLSYAWSGDRFGRAENFSGVPKLPGGVVNVAVINLNHEYFGAKSPGRTGLEKSLQEGNADRFHDGMTDPRSIIAHEYGHHVDAVMGKGTIGHQNTWATQNFGGLKGAKEFRGKDAVSGYGRTDAMEWFAESFAAGVRGYGDARAQSAPGVDKVRAAVTAHFSAKTKAAT